MNLNLLLLLIVIVVLFGGGGYYGYRGGYGPQGFGLIGAAVLIFVLLLVFGHGRIW